MFCIIYSDSTKAIRRIIVPDDAATLQDGTHAPAKGESMLICNMDEYGDLDQCKKLVEQATGVAPIDAVCAVVSDKGAVVDIIMADPDIDAHPAGKLVECYAPDIKVGCAYDAKTELFTVPAEGGKPEVVIAKPIK